ncbi:hypothetical protein Cgig2_025501 [Carnegiea gigantea]|uniref:Uncharacterized protein n=1 Tax=Carnegiea gigantea TaxID=171969 RepID=A0A9Q1JI64_9CARY|nr:hypothetical protein Cgig2_025501 [Carnegiea gigantea]
MDLEAAPLDGQQGTQRSHDMCDTPTMTQEEEGVVVLGSNSIGVHTTQLRNKPKTKKSKPKEFNNRMSPKGLTQLIEKLNDKQREALKEIGFGGFLYLQVDMIRGKLAVWLVRNFDTCSCSLPLTHGRLRVTEYDVYMTLALPKGPLEVTEAKNETNSSAEFKTLLKRWKEQWLDRDSVPKSGKMVKMICSQIDGGEEFKTDFIVLVVSTYINGNQRGEVNYLTERPDEVQVVYEEEPSKPATEAKHDTALLEDAKKASNEIITNTRVLAGVIMELEKLVPKAHASLKRVRTMAVQTTIDALFAETTLSGKSKSTKPFQPRLVHEEESVGPATGVVIRELDVDVPLRDVQEASYVGKGKAIMEEVSRRPRTRSIELDANVPLQDVLEASYVGKGKGILQEV